MVDQNPGQGGRSGRPNIVEQLSLLPLLDGLPVAEIERLAGLVVPVTVEPGGHVVRQGEQGEEIFLIVAGTADVFEHEPSGRAQKVAQMRKGEFFGEISLLTAQPRTADVVASTRLDMLRLRRSDYLQFLAGRTDLHARVTESAAQRAGATLKRLTPGPPLRGTPSPFDRLLHRLIDHEIDTMRAAEVRGDPITFDEVVNFYGATRFLYPAKLGVLETQFDAVRATWERLIAANDDVFKILMLRRVVDGQLVVKNSICAFEYVPGSWQIQHLVSADRHERSGTLASLIGMIDWLYGRPDVKSARWTYRPDNPGTSRLFGGLAAVLPSDRSLHSLLDYYVTRLPPGGPSAQTVLDDVTIRLAEPHDLADVRALYRARHPLMPEWLCLDDPQLVGLNARYRAHGMHRSRDLWLAVRAGQICGTVTCWWASEGVNFSFIENATDDLVIDQAMPADVRTTIARELLTSSMNHYQSRGRPYAVGLVDVESARLDQGIASLPRTSKKYARLCVEHSCFPAAREYFERHYSRLLLQRSDFDESDGGGEFGGPGE